MSDHEPSRPDQPAPAAEPFGMTDLEDALRGPDGPAVRDRVLSRIETLQDTVDSALAQGVARNQYEATRTISAALRAAHGLLRQVAS